MRPGRRRRPGAELLGCTGEPDQRAADASGRVPHGTQDAAAHQGARGTPGGLVRLARGGSGRRPGSRRPGSRRPGSRRPGRTGAGSAGRSGRDGRGGRTERVDRTGRGGRARCADGRLRRGLWRTQGAQHLFDPHPDGVRPLVGELEHPPVQQAEKTLTRRPQQAAFSRREPHDDAPRVPARGTPARPGASTVSRQRPVNPLTVAGRQAQARTRGGRPSARRRHAQQPQSPGQRIHPGTQRNPVRGHRPQVARSHGGVSAQRHGDLHRDDLHVVQDEPGSRTRREPSDHSRSSPPLAAPLACRATRRAVGNSP
jgi:hypothetical protein